MQYGRKPGGAKQICVGISLTGACFRQGQGASSNTAGTPGPDTPA